MMNFFTCLLSVSPTKTKFPEQHKEHVPRAWNRAWAYTKRSITIYQIIKWMTECLTLSLTLAINYKIPSIYLCNDSWLHPLPLLFTSAITVRTLTTPRLIPDPVLIPSGPAYTPRPHAPPQTTAAITYPQSPTPSVVLCYLSSKDQTS